MKNTVSAALSVAVLSVGLFSGADWPQFRGPGGSGISDETGLPTTWSETENVVWKTALPGAGASSPITLGEKIFVTCYSGYGLDKEEPGNQENLQHHVVCLDRATGKILWDKASKALLPERAYRGFVAMHGYASGTPVTDGKAVYAFFGRSGVRAYSLEGELLWQASVGESTHDWGSGTSPLLYGDLLLINACVESKSLVALSKADGKEAWRVVGINESWSTPALVTPPGGKRELAVMMNGKTWGIDPATGEKLWECATVEDYVCPSVLAGEGIVYVTGGRGSARTTAIRAGGRGDVTKTHILWELKKTPKVATPLLDKGLMHWVDQAGVAVCLKADTGELVYSERMTFRGGGDKVYASLVLADGRLYGVSRQGGALVLAPGPAFKLLAANDLGDRSVFNATPVPSKGQLLLRSDKFLYCIGK